MASPMQSTGGESTPRVPAQKFSRYRSVRKAASQRLGEAQPALPAISHGNAITIQQSSTGKEGGTSEDNQSHSPKKLARRVTNDPVSLAALEGRDINVYPAPGSTGSNRANRHGGATGIPDRPRRTDEPPEHNSPRGGNGSPSQAERDLAPRGRDRGNSGKQSNDSPAVLQPQSPKRYSLTGAKGDDGAWKDAPAVGALSADAPISAVNAGDRKVTVVWDDDVFELTISPDTTARQLVAAASARLSRPNNPDLILLESFSQLGLERPIRQYEHVRDIMNSWDRDDLNALMIKSRAPESRASGLAPLEAPKMQPDGLSVSLYYSQRPGKWDKRYIALNSSGQVTVAKREGSETTNICHISDFDVYIPTKRQIKKLRPPKSCCLAIKSQQKSVVFLNGANFVHFFSTADEDLGNKWYDAVQSWRSWYLADALDLHGQPPQFQPSHSTRKRNSLHGTDLGPLISNLNLASSASGRPDTTKQRPQQRKMPPSSFPQASASDPDPSASQSLQHPDEHTFASDSLLGRSYTARRPRAPSNSQPNRMPTVRSSSRTRQPEGAPGAPKPLVDLTPVFQEPPQHARKGRGVAAEPGKFLVENATNRENIQPAIPVPSGAALFRRGDVYAHPVAHTNTRPSGPLLQQPLRQTSVSHQHRGNETTGHGVGSYNRQINKHGMTTTRAGLDEEDWDTPLGDLKMRAMRARGGS